MDVEHALSRALAAVGDYAEAVLEVKVLCQLGDDFVDMCDNGAVIGGHFIQPGDMLLGEESLSELYIQPYYYKTNYEFGQVEHLLEEFCSNGLK